jgi:hypothetical protein
MKKKSAILAAAIAAMITAMTSVANAQDAPPPNCPPGYQCILTDPDAAAKSDQATCPPGYHPDDRGHCLLSDLEAATKSQQAYEQAEQGKKVPDSIVPSAGPNDVSIDDDGSHPDSCWSQRRRYEATHSSDLWWQFQNCLAHKNYNN